ncbi:hypothetical protein BC826DRAFT_996406 [Russula brevipes]|nr:hypothetical protein BC826DRAFT_996406 [Russula brevipes]
MFRPWRPSSQRGSNSRHSTQQRAAVPNRSSHPEDAQPNESVDKRQRHPPAVSTSRVDAQQKRWRGGRDAKFVIWEPPRSTPQTSDRPTLPTVARPAGATRMSEKIPLGPSALPSEAPAPKRRRLEEDPRLTQIKCQLPTERMVSTFTSSASPVSSETLVGEHRLKRGRSTSPALSPEPQLITAGSRRYAPLPPECRKSNPNYKAARNAWAKKEQDELKRLGLKVARTFIREDGMVIDWETTESQPALTAAVIGRALLLNHTAVPGPCVQPSKPTTRPPAHTSRLVDQPRSERESSTPSVVEIGPDAFFGDPGGRESIKVSGPGTGVGPISNPSGDTYRDQEGEIQHQGHVVHEHPAPAHAISGSPAPIALLGVSPGELARRDVPPSNHAIYYQAANNAPSCVTPPSGRAREQSLSPHPPLRPSQQTTSPESQQLSPSQRATETLQNILRLKRQLGPASPDSLNASVSSPSQSLRKLYPMPKRQQSRSPSKQSPGSSADPVAAAINEGTRLDRLVPNRSPPPSTPLRTYKKRLPPSAIHAGRDESSAPKTGEDHETRHSEFSERHSPPPIAVLAPTQSSPGSPEASSSIEYDELELSWPPSPSPSPSRAPPDSRPPAIDLTESPRPAELPEPASRSPSLLVAPSPNKSTNGPLPQGLILPSPDESAVMRSSALQYLEWYCQTFDTDRRALAEAYAPDAVFSCPLRNLRANGRDGIPDALRAIGVLLVMLGTMSDVRDDNGNVGYTMSFVLRPRTEEHQESRSAGGMRPLEAVVHQMMLRDDCRDRC